MTPGKVRSVLRWFHLAAGVVLGSGFYAPWGSTPAFVALMRWGLLPAVGATGVWMWQQGRVRRLLAGSAAARVAVGRVQS